MSFNCNECGKELDSVLEKHTFEDCNAYKDKCNPVNLERRITSLEDKVNSMKEALEGVYFRK